MLSLENNRIAGYGSYEHKENFKFYKCKWDKDAKNWFVPSDADTTMILKLIESINSVEKKKMEERWAEACNVCGFDFVKRGTPEYNKVMDKFKNP